MKIDRAQSRGPGARHVGRGLKNIELRSQSRAEISFCDLEGFIGVLHVAGFRFEDAIRLLEIEKGAPHIRRHRAPRRFQRMQRGVAAGARGLKPPARREAVEKMPGRV